MLGNITVVVIFGVVGVILGVLVVITKIFHQVSQGTALVRNGLGGPLVAFSGMVVVPIFHKIELMDLSVKRIEIFRHGKEGLVCKDNLRADVKLAFFIRVNNKEDDVLRVAQSLGCDMASNLKALIELFDAKFSEALKTVGKQFDFVELYTERKKFKEEIIHVIGKDLNGYVLEDAAIDYLEQTPLELLNPNNILDCEGIKKITSLTAEQAILSNQINRQKEMTIVQQNVKARETVLELERQQAEAEQRQAREVAVVTAREQAESKKIQQEERLKGERARITADEEISIAEKNMDRQVVVAQKNRERTEAVESERVERDRMLEVTEREKLVALAEIAKTRVVENETREIQEVIRQRVHVQKAVAEEEEKIKDIREYATADRLKKVNITHAEMEAEKALVTEIKMAEAAKTAAVFMAQKVEIEKEAERFGYQKLSESKKILAEGIEAEIAAPGLGEARVVEIRAIAEARGIEAKADAYKKQGVIEAEILLLKLTSEANGIEAKATAMKILDGVGRSHEEFKLRLAKERDVELAEIAIQKEVAQVRAEIVGKALQSAKIEIIGGETSFFDKIVGAVSLGKSVDRMVKNSETLKAVSGSFFPSDSESFKSRLSDLVKKIGVSAKDIKTLTISALLSKLGGKNSDLEVKSTVKNLLQSAEKFGYENLPSDGFLIETSPPSPDEKG